MENTKTMTIGGRQVALVAPNDPAVVQDMYVALIGGVAPARLMYAALGLCWTAGGTLGWPKVTLAKCRYDIHAYGGAVYNEFRGRDGWTEALAQQMAEAAREAAKLIDRAYIGGEEIEAVESFGEAPEASSAG